MTAERVRILYAWRTRQPFAGVAVLAIVGAALRFSTLDRQSFWFDELVTVGLVRHRFADMLAAIPHSEATPYTYYVVAWAWTRAFGSGEVGLRSLSALAGTVTIPVVYAAGTTLCSRRVGLLAAALATVSPFLVWYSQEARSYALLTFFAALTVLFFARVVHGGYSGLAGWAVASSLALATHYFALFLVVPEAMLLLARARVRAAAVAAALAPAAVLALEIPLILEQRSSGGLATMRSSLASRAVAIPKELVVGYSFPLELAGSVVAALLVVAGFALALSRQHGREGKGALVAGELLAVAIVVPYVLALSGADYLTARNLVAVLVPGCICVAAGFAVNRFGLAAAAALCALLVAVSLSVSLDLRYGRTDWRGAAARLGPAPTPRAIVVIPAINSRILRIYLPGVHEFQTQVAPVREIAVLGLATQGAFSTGPVRPPAPRMRTPPKGFRLADVEQTSTFTLVRYVADGDTPVSRRQLRQLGLTAIPSGLLIQRPGA